MNHTTHGRTARGLTLAAGAAGLLTLGAIASGLGTHADRLPEEAPSALTTDTTIQPEMTAETAASIGFANSLSAAFQHAAATIEPSVVHITSFDIRRVQPTDLFGRRVGDPREQERRAGLGSGVLIDERGYLVTNNHVIQNSERFEVQLQDGRVFAADLIGADESSDIAVLKIDAPGISAAEWTDSEKAEVGQWVIAVGSPFGLEQTVTAGIVSSKGRTPNELNANSGTRFQEFIQTDAAINPGNSGGPLVDLTGRIVGINTAIATRSGGSQGLGFAVPADLARSVAQSIIESGRVRRGFLGITWEADAIDAQTAYDLGVPGGVRLTVVSPDGPADEAGLEPGDIIVAFNGRVTENSIRLRNAIAIVAPGEGAEVEFIRDGERRVARIVVGDRFADRALALGGRVFSNLGIAAVPRELTMRRGRRVVGTEQGLQIVEIEPGSPADRSGLSVQDIILEADGTRVEDAEDLERVLRRASLTDGFELRVFNGRMIGELFVRDE